MWNNSESFFYTVGVGTLVTRHPHFAPSPPPLHTNMNRTTPLFGTVCLALLPSLLCSKYTGTRARVFANLALSHPPPSPSSFLCLRSFSFPPSLSFRYFYSLCSFYFKCSKTTRMNLTRPTKGSQLTLRKEL